MRLSQLLLLLTGLILPVSGAVAYWGYHTSPEQMVHRGLAELDRGLADEPARIADVLEERGHVNHASFLRGEIWRRTGLSLASTTAGESTSETARSSRARQAFQRALAEFSRVKAGDPLAADSSVLGAECLVRLGERKLAEDGAQPIIFYGHYGICWQPQLKGLTLMVNSLFNGWRMEDVWLDQ